MPDAPPADQVEVPHRADRMSPIAAIGAAIGCTEGQVYTMVIGLILAIVLAIACIPSSIRHHSVALPAVGHAAPTHSGHHGEAVYRSASIR